MDKWGGQGLDVTQAILIGLSFIWGITLTPFTIVHTYQILTNQTTLEYLKNKGEKKRMRRMMRIQSPTRSPDLPGQHTPSPPLPHGQAQFAHEWDVGWLDNWRSIMGSNPLLWFGRCTFAFSFMINSCNNSSRFFTVIPIVVFFDQV